MEHQLNKWLTSHGMYNNLPIYRLVWSEDIMEHRKGTFREFYGDIFLREFNGVRLVRKYNYIHERWIFEAFSVEGGSPEVPGSLEGDYVPIYVFESANSESLPVTRKVLEFLIGALNKRVTKDMIPSEEYLKEKSVGEIEDSWDDHPMHFSTRPGPQRNSIWYKGVKDASRGT